MASSTWRDVSPIWLVRSRQMATQFAFWLAIIGYNKHDRSLSHRVYLGYALAFYALWGFAVLALLAGVCASFLKLIGPAAPTEAAVWISFLTLLAWQVFSLAQAGKRSPVHFSEEDAALICQTPVDRGAVTLLWLPSSWIAEGLPFWAITITLGFALAEVRLKGAVTMLDLPGYVMDGVRPLSIMIPLHLAVLALVWCAGSLRLRPGKSDAGVSAYGPLIAFIALLLGGLVIWQGSAFPWAAGLVNILSAPLRLPIEAGFGLLAWLPGFALACAEAVLCLSALGIVAREISISWAAHESIPGLALTLTDPDSARLHKTRERLGAGRKSTRLPSMPGLGALFWKQVLQTQRTWRIQDALSWLGVFSMGLAVGLVSGIGPLAWVIVVWVIMCGKLTTNPLRDDLKNWYSLRQMPFLTLRLVWVEIALPMAGVVLATWAGLALAVNAPGELRLGLAVLAPAAAAMAAASAVYDIARQARAALLLNGVCPDLSALGALLGLLGPAVCAGGVYWATKSGVPMLVGGLGGMLLCAYMAYLIGGEAAGKIQKME